MKKAFLTICVISCLTCCYGPSALQSKLNRHTYPLGYLHDSPKSEVQSDAVIFPIVIDKSDTTNITTVHKNDGHSFYLLFVYDYNFDLTVNLGKRSVLPSMPEFIKQSFVKESERSGSYGTNSSPESADYQAIIEILEYNVSSKYFKDGSAMGGYQEHSISVMPSNGKLRLQVSLIDKNNNIIFSDEYISIKSAGFVKSRSTSEGEINEGMMLNLTETLAECIKENIAEIVKDLSSAVKQEEV